MTVKLALLMTREGAATFENDNGGDGLSEGWMPGRVPTRGRS